MFKIFTINELSATQLLTAPTQPRHVDASSAGSATELFVTAGPATALSATELSATAGSATALSATELSVTAGSATELSATAR